MHLSRRLAAKHGLTASWKGVWPLLAPVSVQGRLSAQSKGPSGGSLPVSEGDRPGRSKVEQIAQKALALLLAVIVSTGIEALLLMPVRSGRLGGPFNDLVQITAIKPDAPALGAVVDLHATSFGHHQTHAAVRAVHLVYIS